MIYPIDESTKGQPTVLNNEVWKVCDEFPKYEVSSLGRVRNILTGKVLKTFTQNSGYEVISFSVGKTSSKRTLHRLVAIAHIPNPHGKPIVNHLDGNKQNNVASNLEWCTNSENILHARSTGLNPYNKPTANTKMAARNKDGKSSKYLGVTWDSSRKKWIAYVVFNKVKYLNKRFDDEVIAAKHRDLVIKEHNLPYQLNFI